MGGGACSRGRQWRGPLESILYTCEKAEAEKADANVLPMRLGTKRNTFSLDTLFACKFDLARFLEGVRSEGVDTLPLPF